VSASRLAADDEEEAPRPGAGAGGGAEAAARARGRLVSAMMKRHLVESVVPVLVELRRLLGEARSPLMGDLMGCFSAVLKEYKGEVEEILVADKQVGARRGFRWLGGLAETGPGQQGGPRGASGPACRPRLPRPSPVARIHPR
jgi:hypothetical protein